MTIDSCIRSTLLSAKTNWGVLRVLILTGLLCSSTLLPSQNAAQTTQPTQNDVEAAYLYNFGKFVNWPKNAQKNRINICILGSDPFGSTLDRILANETIDGRRLIATRMADIASVRSCSILFIGISETSRLNQDLFAAAGLPILTVSDIPGFVDHGGMIQFFLEDNRVRFEVNLAAADKDDLVLSSQLLKVAAQVVGNPAGKAER